MSRRGNGEGSIYQRKDGRWEGALTLPSGGRRSFYGRTRRDAHAKLHAALRDLQQGLPLTTENQSTEQYLRVWLDGARSTLAATTWQRYEVLVRVHAIPHLGHVPLARLTPQHLQKLYADRLAANSAPASVHQLHAVLHRALEQATRWRLVPRNVASLVTAPKARRSQMQTLSPEQVRTFLASVAGGHHEALYTVAVTTGMRQGELLALRWRDVDLEGRSANVCASLYRGKGGGYDFTQPKTARSRRQVALTQAAVATLRRQRIQQNRERLLAGEEWNDLDLVFANTEGRPLRGTRVTHTFQDALRRSGLPRLRFHDLRHTSATLMLGRGVHPKVASDMLGHATIAVTLDLYSHVAPSMTRGAADELDAVLAGS